MFLNTDFESNYYYCFQRSLKDVTLLKQQRFHQNQHKPVKSKQITTLMMRSGNVLTVAFVKDNMENTNQEQDSFLSWLSIQVPDHLIFIQF